MAYETLSDHTELYNLGEKLYLAGKKWLCILDLDFYTSPRQQLGIELPGEIHCSLLCFLLMPFTHIFTCTHSFLCHWLGECLTPHNVNITLKLRCIIGDEVSMLVTSCVWCSCTERVHPVPTKASKCNGSLCCILATIVLHPSNQLLGCSTMNHSWCVCDKI